MEDSSNAPKFHLDRSQYSEGLLRWFKESHTDHQNVEIGEIDIPVATGFSNETVFFNISSDTQEGTHEGRYVARLSLIHISEPTRPERIGGWGVWV